MAGRGKKKEITAAEMKRAEKFARKGHQTGTICELMGWAHNFIEDRPDIRKRLTKMRAWHKDDIRNDQERIRKARGRNLSAAATMAIFQGKQPETIGGLGQADTIQAEVTTKILNVEGLKPVGD